jgi:TfoX/Sxy family transcriptional regulator of competence genes
VPYDETLATRIGRILSRRKNIVQKKMFGGVGFLMSGNMCVGVWREFLIVRVGPDAYQAALSEPFAKKFDITGRAMTGWVMVHPDGLEADDALKTWIRKAAAFVATLPAKG